MNAARFGRLDAAKLLLGAKAEVNAKDEDGLTALMLAALQGVPDGHPSLIKVADKGKTETVKLLIDAKADVNMKANDGSTALIYAAKNNNDKAD